LLKQDPGRTVRLAGYDNYWACIPEREPEAGPLEATVDKQHLLIAREMVDLLLARIAGQLPAEPQHRTVPVRLIAPTDCGTGVPRG
jgi:DNA-binding LacI/PurR family transcriptional regulator